MRLQQKYKNLLIASLIFCLVLIGENILYPLFQNSLPAFSKAANFFKNLALINRLKQENISLKKSLLDLRGRLQSKKELVEENRRLKSLLGLKKVYKDSKVIFAQVLCRVPVSWQNRLVINKGKKDGITKGSLAVDYQRRLIGKVFSVHKDYSEVITVWDRNFKIGVKVAGDSGVFEGSILSMGRVKYLDYNTPVKTRDKVEVLDIEFPHILLGYVFSLRKNRQAMALDVFVRPAVKKGYFEDLLILVKSR